MIVNILVGLIICGVGGVLIYFSPQLASAFGRSMWAERNVGGTRNAVILFGCLVIIIGILIMFGVLNGMQSVT